MKSRMISLNEIRKAGLEALARALGLISMVRFLQQFDTGKGDYTKEREQWLGEMTVNGVLKTIEEERERR